MIYEIFERLLTNNSRLAKEAVLKSEIDNELFKQVLYLALNPYIKFHVRRTPEIVEGRGTISLQQALNDLSNLYERKITGNAAVDFLENLFHSLSVDDAKVLQKIIDKDLKCGVSTATVNKIWPDLIPEFLIQFASGFDERKIPKRFVIEPKFDGMRAIILCDHNGDVTFFSRGGREIETLDHLIDDIKTLVGKDRNFMFDSEVISGVFENTMSVVKRLGKNAKDEKIYLYIFDHMSYDDFMNKKCDLTYEFRRRYLQDLFFHNNKSEFLVISELDFYGMDFLENPENPKDFIYKIFAKLRSMNYEGAIVKDYDALYNFDRDHSWMKVKPLDHKDVEITGYYEGTKGTKNEGKLGGFTFDEDGVECRAGGGFSDKQREEFWAIKEQMPGKIMQVEFMEKTKKGATRHCNFMCLRDFKGEKS